MPAIPDLMSAGVLACTQAKMLLDLVELDHALVQGYTSPEAYAARLKRTTRLHESMMAAATPAQLRWAPEEAGRCKSDMFGLRSLKCKPEFRASRCTRPNLRIQRLHPLQPSPYPLPPRQLQPFPARCRHSNSTGQMIGMQAAVGALAGKMLFDNPLVGAVSAPLIIHFVGKIPKGG